MDDVRLHHEKHGLVIKDEILLQNNKINFLYPSSSSSSLNSSSFGSPVSSIVSHESEFNNFTTQRQVALTQVIKLKMGRTFTQKI